MKRAWEPLPPRGATRRRPGAALVGRGGEKIGFSPSRARRVSAGEGKKFVFLRLPTGAIVPRGVFLTGAVHTKIGVNVKEGTAAVDVVRRFQRRFV